MGFIALWGTSNTRQFSRYGTYWDKWSRKHQPYHTDDHQCCIIGGNLEKAEEKIASIADIRVASYPGLSLENLHKKRCQAGPFKGNKVRDFVQSVCGQEDFNGTMAILMLCNDEELLNQHDDQALAIKEYFQCFSDEFRRTENFDRVKFIFLNTMMYRQADFTNPTLLQKKKRI